MNTAILSDHIKTLPQKENLALHQISNIYLELVRMQQGRIACAGKPTYLGPCPSSARKELCKFGQVSFI